MIYARNIREKLKKAIKRSPVTLLRGARQTGKTTLVKELTSQDYTYVTFDNEQAYLAAKESPSAFIETLKKPVIIDEIQRVPEIFLAIKHDVDLNRIPGRYILTGSADPLLLPRLGDSLAGRMEILELYPLSQGEIRGYQEDFIAWAFASGASHSTKATSSPSEFEIEYEMLSKPDLIPRILKGGYPLVQNLNEEDRLAWLEGYVSSLLQRDVKDLANISGAIAFPSLLRLLATRISGLSNSAELSRSIGIPLTTLNRYLAILETLFILFHTAPWYTNLGKRMVKSPKTYLVDTGLISYLLGLNSTGLLSNPLLQGGIFENFVISELKKQISWSSHRAELFHLRTVAGVEVDAILEDPSGKLVGIEIKAASVVAAKDAAGLKYLKEALPERFVKGIVFYTGTDIVGLDTSIVAMPISTLWMNYKADSNF